MYDVAAPLLDALAGARSRLSGAAERIALAQTPYGGKRSDGAMAEVAGRAIFTEALLSAAHARLAEIKGVSRSA